jgi:hypothetical protein
MLRFERKNPSPDSKRYINDLIGQVFFQIINITRNFENFPSGHTLLNFRESGKESAIKLIFEKIKDHVEDINLSNSNLSYALGRDGSLYSNNIQLVNKEIDDLLSSNDQQLSNFAIQLREKIMFT